jgi:hypothetical protein
MLSRLEVSFSQAFEWMYLQPDSLSCEITKSYESEMLSILKIRFLLVKKNFVSEKNRN